MKSNKICKIMFTFMCFSFYFLTNISVAISETAISDNVGLIKGRLMYDRLSKVSYFDVSIKNNSNNVYLIPLKVVLKINNSSITVQNADGITKNGEPYFVYNNVLNGLSNEFGNFQYTISKQWRFNNPKMERLNYTYEILGSEAPVNFTEEPSYGKEFIYDLGGEINVPVLTSKYVGKIELPLNFSIKYSDIFIESGIGNITSVTSNGLFKLEMNNDATTLLSAVDGRGDSYLFKLYPKSELIKEVNPIVNAKSTAVAIVAMQAGIITSEPDIDAILLAMLNNLPEVEELADQISSELKQGIFRLTGSSLSNEVLKKCAAAHEAFASASVADVLSLNSNQLAEYYISKAYDKIVPSALAEWVGFDCSDAQTDRIYDSDGIDVDGVCVSAGIEGANLSSTFYLKNKQSRWTALGVRQASGDFDHIDWVEPRNFSIPSSDELIQESLSFFYAAGKEFFNSIFKSNENDEFLYNKLTDILSKYFSNGKSQNEYIFNSTGLKDLVSAGASLKNYDNLFNREVFSSFVMSTSTEVLGPWISVILELKKSEINKSVKVSINEKSCQEYMVKYSANAIPILAETYSTYQDDGSFPAFKYFTKEFIVNNLISTDGPGDGVKVVSCLLKKIISFQNVRALIIEKIAKYGASAGFAAVVDTIDKGTGVFNAVYSSTTFLFSIIKEAEAFDNYNVVIRSSEPLIKLSEPISGEGESTSFFNDQQVEDLYLVLKAGIDTNNGTLKLSNQSSTFPFIWLANSSEGTISKLDVETGEELGRYRTSSSFSSNPSRTTVDQSGNVWVGNRNGNTVTKIGLLEAGQCVDRNNNGVIETSQSKPGFPNLLNWGEDECMLIHTSLFKTGVPTPQDIRLVAIDPQNNVFVGGYYQKSLFKLNGDTGSIIDAVETLQGHYGGVVDKFGNLWSMHSGSGRVEKISNDMKTKELINLGHSGYGITIDKEGKVWTTEYGNRFSSFNPSDPISTLKVYTQISNSSAQGIASDSSGDIFIAGSLSSNLVGHYKNDGTFVMNYTVGSGPTGVAIDANGKVWASNYYSNSASRIDPVSKIVNTFPIGSGPYNYSDMTGMISRNVTTKQGTWNAIFDSKLIDYAWDSVIWKLRDQGVLPAGTGIKVMVRSENSMPAMGGVPYKEIENGAVLKGVIGQYLQIEIKLYTEISGISEEVTGINIY